MKAILVLNSLNALSAEAINRSAVTQPLRGAREEPAHAVAPTRADLPTPSEDSAAFREALLRRYDAPYPDSWLHGGLND
jgi:hypothetical protein